MPEIGDAHQRHAVIERGDNQRPHQRAGDSADAADEAGPAENNGGDGIQLITYAEVAVRAVQPRGAHDAAQPGEQAAHAVNEQQHQPHFDPREPCRLHIAAYGVDMNAKGGAAQNEPAHRYHHQRDHHQPRNRPEVIVADPFEADIGVNHRGAVGQQIGGPA